jgi:hypothetical protein
LRTEENPYPGNAERLLNIFGFGIFSFTFKAKLGLGSTPEKKKNLLSCGNGLNFANNLPISIKNSENPKPS